MKSSRCLAYAAVCLFSTTLSTAQTLDLARGEADPIWRGVQAGARAGASLDQGAVHRGDSRRDLIIGSPGGPGVAGAVYLVFGGTTHTGNNLPLSAASAVIHGGPPGDLFGAMTAAGNVLNVEGTEPRTLVVGAPGALSGRGAVYVFAGGFRENDSLSIADAAATILGATGDQLGVALATADLNNDGFREVVIGAPGNGRIYVISGGAGLSGTIDLSVTSAARTIEYPGLGVNLSAGDITGDGIYDLLAGHPAANAVHVMSGRNGSIPTAFNMTFGGIDPGDGVGRSIRLSDIDNDGRSDIIVGAPDGDGPGNTRANAGEAYLIWGGPTVTGRSMQVADVTFYGTEVGGRLGSMLAGGDINRDSPDDLVFVLGNARAGAGSLYVYYGRSRNSIGVPRGDGPRVVDFASQAPNRAILGDTAGGTITAVQVYEVTGEGARDVIVGMSGNNGGVGSVYFTISPRLTLGSTNASLSGFQGIVSSAPISVRNVSEIPITWRTSTNSSWLSATPEGSTSASAFGDVVISANGQGLAPGTHTGVVTVTSTSNHLTMFNRINVTFVVKETQPSPTAPAVPGAPPGALYNILWRHGTEGWLAFWNMNGVTMTGSSSVSINQMTDTTWRIAAFADLNGDGHRDIIWEHVGDGVLAAWFLQGNRVTSTVFLSIDRAGPGWRVMAAGDANGDGRADLFFQHTAGSLAVWFMNGNQVIGTRFLSIDRVTDLNWSIAGAGDTNGDGKADLLWQHRTEGWLAVWRLNGHQVTSTQLLSINKMTDPNWKVVGVQDVNGDRKADILWQHAAGDVATWYLDSEIVRSTLLLNPGRVASTAWRIAGPK
jgi:hypothetical protein